MDCYCDYDLPDWVSSHRHTSRNEYHCDECARTISVGEKYERTTGRWGGHVDTFFSCHQCHDLRQWVQNNVPCFCWEYENMHEAAKEAVSGACWRAPEETKGLWFGLLRKFVAVRRARRSKKWAT